MSNDPYPNLLFPTCAEAAGIGISAIPELLWAMEDDCGPEVMKAVVLTFGGREISVSRVQCFPFDRDPILIGLGWIYKQNGSGHLRIPKGPGARPARGAWTAFRLLQGGASLSEVSRATGSDMRTISNIKRKLRAIGALPEKEIGK